MLLNVYRTLDGGYLLSPGLLFLVLDVQRAHDAQHLGILDCDDLPVECGTDIVRDVCRSQQLYVRQDIGRRLGLEGLLAPAVWTPHAPGGFPPCGARWQR